MDPTGLSLTRRPALRAINQPIHACSDACSAQVPAAKKTLERYLYVLRQFFTDSNLSKALRIGTLKHRAADGKLETSQLFPEEFKTQAEEREVRYCVYIGVLHDLVEASVGLCKPPPLGNMSEDAKAAVPFRLIPLAVHVSWHPKASPEAPNY